MHWRLSSEAVSAIIRPLAPGDTARVVALSLRAWVPVFRSFEAVLGSRIYQQVYPDWKASQAKAVEATCNDPQARVWVAEVQNSPVGFVVIVFHDEPRSGEIFMLAVDPELEGQGIGGGLFELALDQILRAGFSLATVSTGGDPGHAAARQVYERAGFVGLPQVWYCKALWIEASEMGGPSHTTNGDHDGGRLPGHCAGGRRCSRHRQTNSRCSPVCATWCRLVSILMQRPCLWRNQASHCLLASFALRSLFKRRCIRLPLSTPTPIIEM
jgi:GNAT superfamily N-acetyltransferase